MSKILVVAPHADDEVLGCGGTIKKLSDEGNDVFVAVMTNASVGAPHIFSQEDIDIVREEAKTAHKLLGVRETFFYEFPAPILHTYPQTEIASALFKLITKLEITDMFIPHRGDIHRDHGEIFSAALVAARPRNNNTVDNVFSYETLSETEWAPPFADDAFIPNYFINISDTLDAKIDAMKCFDSQVMTFPNSRSIEAINALAVFRGVTVSWSAAEAFMVIRMKRM